MDQKQEYSFEDLVAKSVKKIPKKFRDLFDNLIFVVEDFPTDEQIQRMQLHGKYSLLGLYEGVNIGRRGHYSGYLPDKITIFQKTHEMRATNLEELQQLVDDTVWHEVGHYLGMNEEQVRKMEAERNKKRSHVN